MSTVPILHEDMHDSINCDIYTNRMHPKIDVVALKLSFLWASGIKGRNYGRVWSKSVGVQIML